MNIWIELTTAGIEVFLLFYFFFGFFDFQPIRRINAIIGFLAYGALLAVFSIHLPVSLFRTTLIICITYFLVKYIFERPWITTLYPTFVFFTASVLADVICGAIFQALGISVVEFMGSGAARAVYNSIAKLLHLLFLYITLRVTKRHYEKNTIRGCLPLISCIVVSALICFFNFYSWMNETALTGALFGSLGLLYINIMICVYIEVMNRSFVRKQEDALAEQHMEVRENYYHDLLERQEETRALWHDIKKYLAAMEALVGSENRAEARRCLDSVSESFSRLEKSVDTGNSLIDSILAYGIKRASTVGVIVEPQIWVDSQINIPAEDLFIIIGNTMDNAIEASSHLAEAEDRRITLTIHQKNHVLLYEIQNAYSDEHDNISRKIHGYGLKNVRTCVERNEGSMYILNDNHCFTVSIRLNV